MIHIINKILISIVALLNIYESIRILYLAKKDNYNNDDFLKSNNNNLTKILNITNACLLIYFFIIASLEYRHLAIIIFYINFFYEIFTYNTSILKMIKTEVS